MKEKFTGTEESFNEGIDSTNLQIKERKNIENGIQVKFIDGLILNWYPSTGNLNFQGQRDKDIETRILSALSSCIQEPSTAKQSINQGTDDNKIFVVHGHDIASRENLELILRRWSLTPIVIQDMSSSGKSIIESLEEHVKSCRVGIVLMTPDDYGYAKSDKDKEDRKPRARQNVIFEMGMLIGWLGRKKVIIMKKGNLEKPSDIAGLIYLEYNSKPEEIKDKLRQQFAALDIQISQDSY